MVGWPHRVSNMNRSVVHEIKHQIKKGKTLAQIAKGLETTTWVLFSEIRNHLSASRLQRFAATGDTPQSIAEIYGVSVSLVYKQIRYLRLQHLFFDQLMPCRDVCPIIVRLMGMTGANLNEVRKAACPHIGYARLRRFVDREGMAHYFEGEPLLPRVQWVEKCPPLFDLHDIATRVIRNDSPKQYETQERHAPALRTAYKRLGATNWEEAQTNARHILGAKTC